MKVISERKEVINGGITVLTGVLECASAEEKPVGRYWRAEATETDTGRRFVFENGDWSPMGGEAEPAKPKKSRKKVAQDAQEQ